MEQHAQNEMDPRARLLGETIDVALLDQVVQAMNSLDPEERRQANELLCELKADSDSWLKVDAILEQAQVEQTKYLGLQILQDVIRTRWSTLPKEQTIGIREYLTRSISTLCTNDLKSTLLKKMNVVLVEILKKDWPQHWPSFIPDILAVSEEHRNMCINSMEIFALLSEDVFDFGNQTMTNAQETYLKENFCSQFEQIFNFCMRCLKDCPTVDIVTAVLKTIRRFLVWIPVPSVYDSELISILVEKFLAIDNYRIHVLDCLMEISQIPLKSCGPYCAKAKNMFIAAVKVISDYIGENTDFELVYKTSGDEKDRQFLSSLTFFIASFLKEYDTYIEEHREDNDQEVHKYALRLLLKLSLVDDVEIWKMCLEYWLLLTSELYRQNPYPNNTRANPAFHLLARQPIDSRLIFHRDILSDLRDVVITKMARPEEVLLVENESGEVVREIIRDTDNIDLYKTCKETLIFLTHLDNVETMEKMTSKLSEQLSENGFDRPRLNTLCWAIGSISNILAEEEEKRFLVIVIRDLLSLCEMKRGKDNKAAIAANIMYVVGQYYRFLRNHWKFLRTVINKLFEFMHESHEGVQDMACDTFIKIVVKCKRYFVVVQQGEATPFLEEMLVNLSANTCDLTAEQQCVFYEAMGHVVGAVANEDERLIYLARLLAFANDTWERCIRELALQESPIVALVDINISRDIVHCVKLCSSVCRSFGFLFHVQLSPKFNDLLAIYRLISTALTSDFVNQIDVQISKNFRAYKREFLVLMSTWISQENSLEILKRDFFVPLMDAILHDYVANPPELRDAKVLSLLAIVVTRMEDEISEHIGAILDAVLECTIHMITQDMVTFPEHRVNFFQLLLAICSEAFPALLSMSEEVVNFILQAIFWAFQNSLREVAELGLDITKEILDKISHMALHGNNEGQQVAQYFYEKFFVRILEHVFAAVADFNQVKIAGEARYAEILCALFTGLESAINIPLNKENQQMSNKDYISEYLRNIFTQHYSEHLNAEQIQMFIIGFFTFSNDPTAMKAHFHDFTIKLQEIQKKEPGEQDLLLAERQRAIMEAMQRR